MRSFKTTAILFVIGVLASKVIAGSVDTPLYNRFQGEVHDGNSWRSPKTGVKMEFELYRVGYGDRKRYIDFKFTGKPESVAALGLPKGKVTCYVTDAGKPSQRRLPGLNLLYKLKGDSDFCSGIQFGASQGENYIWVLFDGKDKILSSQVRKRNSRGFIVSMMQNWKYSDWTINGGA